MNTLIHFLIFLFVLFLYIHVTAQFKKSEDLEVYEMDYSSNIHLQEVCDIKQPILFEYKAVCPEFFEKVSDETLFGDGGIACDSFDLKIKETGDYWLENTDTVDYVVLPFKSSHTLLSTDTNSRYFTENNHEFVEDAGLSIPFELNDKYFKPSMTVQTKYDICMGSKGAYSPLRYHTYYRDFRCVVSGKITVKMTPFKSTKYLYPIDDYDNYEFWSPVDPWKTQKKYLHEMDKIKFLEFDVFAGNVLYIPPYWWYSIQYNENDTVVCGFIYNSAMNCLSNSVNWGRYFLQQSNIKKNVVKTIDMKEHESEHIEIENAVTSADDKVVETGTV